MCLGHATVRQGTDIRNTKVWRRQGTETPQNQAGLGVGMGRDAVTAKCQSFGEGSIQGKSCLLEDFGHANLFRPSPFSRSHKWQISLND